MATDIIDTYIDMNYYFSKAISNDERLKAIITNTCEYQGILTYCDDPVINEFYERTFDKGNAFRVMFCDDLGEECQDCSFYFGSFDMKRTENVPEVFKYKFEIYNKLYGLKRLVSTSPFETDYFFTEEIDRFMISKLKDCKKFTYQTDETITELPFTEEDFLTNYVDIFDEFPVLTQLIIVEMFYLHYKLEDDFVKYDVIMEIINRIKTLNTNVPYNLACVLYAYLVLMKITVTKLDTADGTYPPDYWGNE